MITSFPRLAGVALLAAVAACASPREDAKGELQRLGTALESHVARYGRYPDTLDTRLPSGPANLPYDARKGVSLRLVHAGADGYQALARRGPWICSLNVDANRAGRLECTPLSSAAEDAPLAPGGGANPMDSVLHPGGKTQ